MAKSRSAAFSKSVVALTKTDHAYRELKRQILEGELEPGRTLDQESLAESMGLSTTPVREALRRLEAERLVLTRAHRDSTVAPISIELLQDIYAMRLELDPLAAALAAANATESEFAEMRRLLGRTPSSRSAMVHLQHNRALHRSIYACCRNELLVETLESLWDLSDRYRLVTLRAGDTIPAATAEHAQIVDAVVARDSVRAASLMREHTAASLQKIRSLSLMSDS